MPEKFRPLNRSITVGCILFIIALGAVVSFVDYAAFHKGLYERNDVYLTDLLHFIDRNIDKDDLAECSRTLVQSEKYNILQTFLDSIVDSYDVDYVYILKPVSMDAYDNCLIIINGITKEEYETSYDELYFLGDVTYDSFPQSTMLSFFAAMERPGQITFDQDEEATEWGYDYTGMLPLQDSSGQVFALLCVDISVSAIRTTLFRHLFLVLAIIIVSGIAFCIVFIHWSRRHIIHPVNALERSVTAFAATSHNQTDPSHLVYREPDIHTGNEVELLAKSITQMASDIQQYAKNILAVESKVSNLQQNVAELDVLAYQDSLTHVKNKASFDKTAERLARSMDGHSSAFAMLMIDLNHLKMINDTYGHERGNDYLTGACQIICEVYEHSPVFRIGGDEFVVLLENRDYGARERLLQELEAAFSAAGSDASREPWLRFSAAIGMAVYDAAVDADIESVLRRADKAMYKNKLAMHASEGR